MKERETSIEFLRIVAMLMILVVHLDGAVLGLPNPDLHWSATDWCKTVVEAISIVGVNLFVLISGWFGINTRKDHIQQKMLNADARQH